MQNKRAIHVFIDKRIYSEKYLIQCDNLTKSIGMCNSQLRHDVYEEEKNKDQDKPL
jgi:hypothetical protein